MNGLPEIEAFVAVAELGSFVAAAESLGVTSSYTSKLVSRLEERLGVRLIHRTTRRHSLTPAGERYLADCQEAFGLLKRSEERLHEAAEAVRGELRVTAPTGLGLGAMSRIFNAFAIAHPEVRLSVSYLDRVVDIVGERFDLAVRVGDLADSTLRGRRIGAYPKRLVASPDLAAALGSLTHPEGLQGTPGLGYAGSARPGTWTLHSGDQTATISVDCRMESNSGRALALAAADGLGVAFLPTFHTWELVAAGRLVHVLPAWGHQVPVHLVFPTQRHLPLRVRALIDHIASELAATEIEPDRSGSSAVASGASRGNLGATEGS